MKHFTAIASLLVGAVFCHVAAGQTCPPGNPRIAPNSRFVDHGDGTVTDQQSGLLWKRCSDGQSGADCGGSASAQNWQQALVTASSSTFAGYGDWRLPSVTELLSLVETGCHSPAINTTRFPNTPDTFYWSSTTLATDRSSAQVVDFGDGYNGGSKTNSHAVRLVRAGQ